MTDLNILVKRISNIKNRKLYKKLFKLILFYNVEYTKNSNGVYFNMSDLSDGVITEIDKLVSHYEYL